MLYRAWVNYYKLTSQWLLTEQFQAWIFGPVIPEVYYTYYTYAAVPIRERTAPSVMPNHPALDVLDDIIEDNTTTREDEYLEICKEGSPWEKTFRPGEERRIPYQLIILACGGPMYHSTDEIVLEGPDERCRCCRFLHNCL